MSSYDKPVNTHARVIRALAALFLVSILHLTVSPLLMYYWLRDNNGPVLTPNSDYRVAWVSDDDFRGLGRSTGPGYRSKEGWTMTEIRSWRASMPDYVSSPDGKWHAEVSARGPLTPYGVRAYLLGAVPAVVFSVMGLGVCLLGLNADSSTKGKGPDPSLQDLS